MEQKKREITLQGSNCGPACAEGIFLEANRYGSAVIKALLGKKAVGDYSAILIILKFVIDESAIQLVVLIAALVVGGKISEVMIGSLHFVVAGRCNFPVLHGKVPVRLNILSVKELCCLLCFAAQLVAERRVGAGSVVKLKTIRVETVHVESMVT